MKKINTFFKKKNKISISIISKSINSTNKIKNDNINNIKDLKNANLKDISFFNSLKYLDLLKKTKAKYIITNKKYADKLRTNQIPLYVENVLK